MKNSAVCSRVVLALLIVVFATSCGPSPEKTRQDIDDDGEYVGVVCCDFMLRMSLTGA